MQDKGKTATTRQQPKDGRNKLNAQEIIENKTGK